MKTHTGGVVPIMNQYDMCQLVQKWFLVCWDGALPGQPGASPSSGSEQTEIVITAKAMGDTCC